MDRIFLGIVAAAYFVLAAWCSLSPAHTSKSVGFALDAGSGQSEFLTVYGGLELALGIAFLWPVIRSEDVSYPLFLCLLVHGCLVAFRTASFVLYRGIPETTYYLAATDWVFFVGAAILFWQKR